MPQFARFRRPKSAKCGHLRAWQMRKLDLACRGARSDSPTGFDGRRNSRRRSRGASARPDQAYFATSAPLVRARAIFRVTTTTGVCATISSRSLWGAGAHPGEAGRCESSSANEAGLRTLLQFNARGRLSRLPRPAPMGEGVCSRARPERSKVATSRRLEWSARLPRSAGRRSLGGSCRRSASARCGA
jgi:hypothetical protein